jgi:hypothetical protein
MEGLSLVESNMSWNPRGESKMRPTLAFNFWHGKYVLDKASRDGVLAHKPIDQVLSGVITIHASRAVFVI